MMRILVWVVVSLSASAATVRAEALHSVKSGNWSDATVWNAGRAPASGDAITITAGHVVVFEVNSPPLAGVTVQTGATLTFDPNVSATLQSTGSVVVRGTLAMKPSSPAVVHLLQFVNVNEAAFVGGGLEVVPGDVGLWVRDGQLDLEGTPKTSWTRLAGYPTKIRNTIFRNATNAIHFREGERATWLDLELCTILTTNDVVFDANAVPDNRVRKQCDTQAFDISLTGRVAIAPFVQPYLDESKPQVSIVSPSGGSIVSGTVNIQSYTYDLSGMTTVDLYVDDVFVASSSSAPFTLSWNSASVTNGRHDLQLRGVDAAGLTNFSARTTVFVQNVP